MTTKTELGISEDPILSAHAKADRAIDEHIALACDGDEHSGKIVASATGLRRTAELLGKIRYVSPKDLAILGKRAVELEQLISAL